MGHFYVFNFRKWKIWSVVIVLVCMLAFFLWLQRAIIFPFFYDDQPAAVAKGSHNQPHIALTFNISWGDEKVNDILDRLEAEDVQATFFVSGEWAERHPHILEDISEGSHELGMLGYRYKSYLKQDIDVVRRDLFQAKQVFDKLGYDEVEWLRPPSGHFDDDIEQLADDLGLTLVHWTINPNDWENPGKDVIVDSIMKDVSKGDIILLHASDAAKQTAGALEELIPLVNNKKLSFVTISELMSQIKTEAEIVE